MKIYLLWKVCSVVQKMNMVTFSTFEKQNCNILHFLHKFRTHTGYSSHASNGRILPTPSKNPARNPCKKAERPPREPPSSPRINRRKTLNFVLKLYGASHRKAPQVPRIPLACRLSAQATHSPEARSLAPQISDQRDVHRQSTR